MKLIFLLKLNATVFILGLFLKGFFPLKKTWDSKSHANGLAQEMKSHLEPEKDPDLDLDQYLLKSRLTTSRLNSELRESKSFLKLKHFDSAILHDVMVDPVPSHPRIILMIIDAFREDFAYGPLRFMPLTHDILNNGKGLKFTAETMPPTVTLPRIKALMTGSTSSFADVVLNFGSSALEEDNVISRLKADGRSIIFFGDDTWLKLFPKHFERSDGTTSFFVSDYSEVDDNVTRHLQPELDRPTWNVMILHYLGLDHIGHFAGPRSPLIGPKLAEMDNIISQIYTAMEQWMEPSMLIVCGDHGMSDQGGHGGASPGEITVPVLFLSPQIYNSDSKHFGTISQTDLCPTLAVLLGVPIPNGNIGRVVTEALLGYSLQQKVAILHHNAKQAMNILRECVSDLNKESAYILLQETEQKLHKWFTSKNSSSKEIWESQGQSFIASLSESLTLISEKVSKLATQYDVYAMAIAIVLMWMMLVSLVLSFIQKDDQVGTQSASVSFSMTLVLPLLGSAILSHIIMCTGGVPSDMVCSATVSSALVQIALAVLFVCLAVYIINSWPSLTTLGKQFKITMCRCSLVEILLLLGTVIHTLTLLSSSFVEEEHQTFYFFTTTLHLFIILELVLKYVQGFRTAPQSKDSVLKFVRGKGRPNRDGKFAFGNKYRTCEPVKLEDHLYTGLVNIDQPKEEINAEIQNSLDTNTEDNFLKVCDHDQFEENFQSSSPKVTRDQFTVESNMTTTKLLHWTFSVVVVLLMLRVLRRWNHTGNKWLDIPDFGDWLVKPENKSYLSLLTVFAFMIIGASRGNHLKRAQTMFVNLALCCAYLCRVAEGNLIFPYRKFLSSSGVLEARASYFFIALTCLISLLPENFLKLENKTKPPQAEQSSLPAISANCESDKLSTTISNQSSSSGHGIKKKKNSDLSLMPKEADSNTSAVMDDSFSIYQRLRGVMAAIICFACLVKQPHNAPIAAVMSLTEQIMTPVLMQTSCRPVYTLLYYVWMGHVFFFLQGNSNSLSTVDIAASYIGLDSYWPLVNGILMLLTTYVGTIFWSFAFLYFVFLNQEQNTKKRMCSIPDSSCRALLLTRVLPLSVYMALVASQRYHLFVWSVFSPKMIYEAVSTVVVALQLLLFIGISKINEYLM